MSDFDVVLFVCLFVVLVFRDIVFLSNPVCPGTYSVDQTGRQTDTLSLA